MTGRWHGRTALITGASNGVGTEIARALAQEGATLLLPVRDRERGFRAADSIRDTVPHARIELYDLDLASLASVDRLATALRGIRLDLYVMNAGVIRLGDRQRRLTEDGHELHFQTNFLGHFALTNALLPQLPGARIAVQGSLAAAFRRLGWNDLQTARRYTPFRAYAASKVALGLFGLELARIGGVEGFSVNLCHPGVVPDTGVTAGLHRGNRLGPAGAIARRIGSTPAEAAASAVMALGSDAPSPGYYAPTRFFGCSGPPAARPFPSTLVDPDDQGRIWRMAEQLIGAARPA